MDKTYTIFWRVSSTIDSTATRGGMSRIMTTTKRAALKHLRERVAPTRDERLIIDSVIA